MTASIFWAPGVEVVGRAETHHVSIVVPVERSSLLENGLDMGNEDDVLWTTALVEKCCSTLESLTIDIRSAFVQYLRLV